MVTTSPSQPPTRTQALEGLVVVDLSNVATGAQASQLFADFGAEVVHIEPLGGSPLRSLPSYPFLARGKKSIELNLHDPSDAAVARALALDADVLIETYRPGVVERMGLGYDDLVQENPRLVYGSVTGFGRTGPYANLPGYEGVVMAKLGALWTLAEMSDRPGPCFPSAPYCTYPASQLLAQGVLAALYERETSGKGQRVDTSLVQGLTVHDTFQWFARLLAMRYKMAYGQTPLSTQGVPAGGLSFRLLIALTKDGRWLQFSQTADRLFRAMMSAMDLDWMFDDPKWKSAPEFEDIETRVAFWEQMLAVVRSKTVAEWSVVFDEHPDVWGELFRKDAEVLDHPQMVWNGSVAEVDDPARGVVRQPGPIVQMNLTPARLACSAPAIAEHAKELRERAAAQTTDAAAKPSEETNRVDGADRRPPLEGVTVLELGTYYAAPFGTTLLAEMGARVIKIEQLDGDPMRNMLPFPEIAGIKALQGKESFGVDIATDAGRKLVYELVGKADIVLQSFRAGVAERLKLDADSLQKVNPNLVYLCAPGYGTGGPCGHRPAYAPTIGAGAGIALRNAGTSIPERDDLPVADVKNAAMRLARAVMGVGNADGLSSVTVGTALMLGLVARQRGAGAQQMLTTMLSTTAHALADTTVVYDGRPAVAVADPGLHGFSALYRLYETAEGWVFLAAPGEREWISLASALRSVTDLSADARFATAATRHKFDAALIAVLEDVFRSRPATDWENELVPAGVACVVANLGPVEANIMDEGSVGEVCGLLAQTTHPMLDGHVRLTPLVTMSRSVGIANGGCGIGQQTDAVLRELGHSESAIEALRAEKIVGP